MAGKPPAFQFYPNDWIRDLLEHPLDIEGAWIRIICKLWYSKPRGKLGLSLSQWTRLLGEDTIETSRILEYLSQEKIANLTESNGIITVISRRMVKDEKERENNRLRQSKHYKKKEPNANLTPISQKPHTTSSSSSSSSTSKNKEIVSNDTTKKDAELKKDYHKKVDSLFEDWWKIYPRKITKVSARKKWHEKIKYPEAALLNISVLQDQLEDSTYFDLSENMKHCPHPSTYINQERWKDTAPQDKTDTEPDNKTNKVTYDFDAYREDMIKALPEANKRFDDIKKKMRDEHLNDRSYNTWFVPLFVAAFNKTSITICVPKPYFIGWLTEHYMPLLTEYIKIKNIQLTSRIPDKYKRSEDAGT